MFSVHFCFPINVLPSASPREKVSSTHHVIPSKKNTSLEAWQRQRRKRCGRWEKCRCYGGRGGTKGRKGGLRRWCQYAYTNHRASNGPFSSPSTVQPFPSALHTCSTNVLSMSDNTFCDFDFVFEILILILTFIPHFSLSPVFYFYFFLSHRH